MLDDRHPATETTVRLCEFEAHIASAHHNEVFGQPIELEGLNILQRPALCQARHRRNRRVGAEIQEDSLPDRRSRPAAIEAHDKGFRTRKFASPMMSSAPVAL